MSRGSGRSPAAGRHCGRLSLSTMRRAHAFVEIVAPADARDDAKLQRHRRLERQVGAEPHLSQRDRRAGRRFRRQHVAAAACANSEPLAAARAPRSMLSASSLREGALDRRGLGQQRRGRRRGRELGDDGARRRRRRSSACASAGSLRRSTIGGREPERGHVGAVGAQAGRRQGDADAVRQARQQRRSRRRRGRSRCRPPASRKRLSRVATRCEPCSETPTPPPMTMPSISET